MNTTENSEIRDQFRELTASELDAVTGAKGQTCADIARYIGEVARAAAFEKCTATKHVSQC